MKKTRKLTEDQLVSEMPATEQPIPATQSEISQASAQVAPEPVAQAPIEPAPVAPVAPQPEAPSNAPSVPVNPLRPPVDGMIPTGWAYPEDLAQALALDTGNVDVAGTAPDATVTPAPEPMAEPETEPVGEPTADDMFESTKEDNMERKLVEAEDDFDVENILASVGDEEVADALDEPVEDNAEEVVAEEPVAEEDAVEEPEVNEFGEIKVSDDELDALLAKIPDALDDLIAGVEDNVEDFKAELGIEDEPEEDTEDELPEELPEEPVEDELPEEDFADAEDDFAEPEDDLADAESEDPLTGHKSISFDEKKLQRVKAIREARKAREALRVTESTDEAVLRERQLRRARINARRKLSEMTVRRTPSFRESERPVRREPRRLSEREIRRVRAQRIAEDRERPVNRVYRPMHDVTPMHEGRRVARRVFNETERRPAPRFHEERRTSPRFHEERRPVRRAPEERMSAPRAVRRAPAMDRNHVRPTESFEEKSRIARERLLNEARKAKALKLQKKEVKLDESAMDTSKIVFPKGTTEKESKIMNSVRVDNKLVKTNENVTSLGDRLKENQKELMRVPGVTDHNEKFNEALKGTVAVVSENVNKDSWVNNRFDEKHNKNNTLNWKKMMSEGMFG